jgi:hypothetical protein
MQFRHEQLDVDRVWIRYVTWAYQLECAWIQDCLQACDVLAAAQNAQGKAMLTRIISVLTKLRQRHHAVRENLGPYDSFDNDNDNE